ncbi:MAG: alternative ribosome rescue aminoacyl-tRNA hydrolase ArfB [Polyangiaceae bacterium]
MSPLPVFESLTIPADDLQFRSVRSPGPGGQNVNKVASKVELYFDVHATRVLDEKTKLRLLELVGRRRARDGRVLIVADETRDRERNLALARDRLAGFVRLALVEPKPRKLTTPSKGAKRRRLADKRANSAVKRLRADRGE